VILELLEASMLPIASAIAWRIALNRKTRDVEVTCTGYVSTHNVGVRDDCKSRRNPTCIDGRCSYHCKQMCKCDAVFEEGSSR
jgi:hypothetical protein